MTKGLTWQGTDLATEYFAVSSRILSLSFAPFLLNFGRKSSSSCLDDSKGILSRVRVQVNEHSVTRTCFTRFPFCNQLSCSQLFFHCQAHDHIPVGEGCDEHWPFEIGNVFFMSNPSILL
ncbi:(+)-delta-cadinene synthase isozyme C2 [Corchorus olitorius]|uniref:(+)-delta-cadinene synthase isozyme C2 n=1 Tax=Corchorus olitorius TaxID=93759 RepID=A0A1R3KLX3_9ROSI|nr:(+)-delta-cadinene synthase isozyme C2 [Corchorus olitorius]